MAKEVFYSSPYRATYKSTAGAELVVRQMRLDKVVEPRSYTLQMLTISSTARRPVITLDVSVKMTYI